MTATKASGLLVTGTDTDVGKTVLTAALARRFVRDGINAGIYKPACSGAYRAENSNDWKWADVEAHYEALNGRYPRERICPQCFLAPLAPPVAAQKQGVTVSRQLLEEGLSWWQENCELLLIEGAGGLLCPLTDQTTVAGFAEHAGYPLIIVARCGLGTINHTLLTAAVARNRGLVVAGVVLNQTAPDDSLEAAQENAAMIKRYGRIRVLGIHPWKGDGRLLEEGELRPVDWIGLARTPRSH